MKNVLDKTVKGRLFKGESNQQFCDRVIDYFLPRFNNPIHYIHQNGFASFHGIIGEGNIENLKLFSETEGGKFYVVVKDDGRTFRTELLPEMVKYIVSKLFPATEPQNS
jgi:hypothetical protein